MDLMTSAAPSRRHPHGSLIVLVALAVLWAGWALWFLTAPDANPGGQCEGLGFGCTLTPRDVASFVGVIALAPFTALVLAVTGAVRIVRISTGSPRTVWDAVVWLLVLAGLGAVVIGTLRGAF